MKTIKDYDGTEAIDKVIEISEYITPIIADSDIMGDLENTDVGKLGALALKKYPEECNKIREALGNEPAASALGAAYGMSQLIFEILSDKDIIDFFLSMSKTVNKSTSAAQNTKVEG